MKIVFFSVAIIAFIGLACMSWWPHESNDGLEGLAGFCICGFGIGICLFMASICAD